MSFANPIGVLALAGLAAVVLLHLLRVRARQVSASTLFLLETTEAPGEAGRRLDRLRASPLFWIQLAAILLLTWVLVEPRWIREDSTLRVVLVLDGSASMSVFQDRLRSALDESLPRLESTASRVEWIVLASDPRERTLYAGPSREQAMEAALSFRVRLPGHDPTPVLSSARSLASDSGLVLFLTDHRALVPPGVSVLAVGEAIENVGFAGVEVSEDGSFRAIVKNSGSGRAARRYAIEQEGLPPSAAGRIELDAGEVRFLSGALAPGEENLALVLEGDRFVLDDRLPIVRPRAKVLRVFVAPELEENGFLRRFLETLSPTERAAAPEASDLAFIREPAGGTSSILVPRPVKDAGWIDGPIVSERGSLAEGLDLQGLVAREIPSLDLEASDRVLVWQEGRPLVLLRARSLVLGFALEESNASRVPGAVLLLHRFAEQVRMEAVGFEQRNVELRQMVSSGPLALRAPDEPDWFELRHRGELLLSGAAHFADVREADFTGASSRPLESGAANEARARNSLPDPFRSIWILTVLALAVAAWSFQDREG